MPPQNTEDLLNPERVYYRMIKDYAEGRLTQTGVRLYRAVVEEVSREPGDLEQNPICPVNSVRARIYTSGMDMSIPSIALTIFHPLMPAHLSPPIAPGEHVYVTFEDPGMSHGLWIAPIGIYSTDANNSNPDIREHSENNAATTFEGNSGTRQRTPNPELQYGGATTRSSGAQRVVDSMETGNSNVWRGKKVVHIGDSMVAGSLNVEGNREPPGPAPYQLRRVLTSLGVASYKIMGRTSWGVDNWLTGRHPRRNYQEPATVPQIISREAPNIIFCILGGNDATNGAIDRPDYRSKVQRLWGQINSVSDFAIWCGPPSVVPRRNGNSPVSGMTIEQFNAKRDRVNDVIRSVVGENNFIDCRQITRGKPRADGIHFPARANIGHEWARLFRTTGERLG